MTRLVWTRQAVQDLEAIREFIARDSPRFGDLTVDRLVSAADRLNQFPLSGRMVPEFRRKDLREVLYGNYRIVYRVLKGAVEIVTVFHSSRLLSSPEDLDSP